jgi:hypothetical protein
VLAFVVRSAKKENASLGNRDVRAIGDRSPWEHLVARRISPAWFRLHRTVARPCPLLGESNLNTNEWTALKAVHSE